MIFRLPSLRVVGAALVLPLAAALAATAAAPLTVERASISPTETEGNGASYGPVAISDDGTFVAFASDANNFTPRDTNTRTDIFVRNRVTGFTEVASVARGGVLGGGNSGVPTISGDGRFVAFESLSTNLVTGDANGQSDVFVRDRRGVTVRVSVSSARAEGNAVSSHGFISSDGKFVAFRSDATNLDPRDNNGFPDVFVQQLVDDPFLGLTTGQLDMVSVSASGVIGNEASGYPSLSANGRFVAFESKASNLVLGDTNIAADIFVKDRSTGIVELVSVGRNPDGTPRLSNGDSSLPVISADGNFVAYVSLASNLTDTADGNTAADVFLYDRLNKTTKRLSVTSDGVEGTGASGVATGVTPSNANDRIAGRPAISADGRFVAFPSDAPNLDPTDANLQTDIFVSDAGSDATSLGSVADDGTQSDGPSIFAALSGDGRTLGYSSTGTALVPDDNNGVSDVFVAPVALGFGANEPPVADAGLDQTVNEGDLVQLDAGSSFDPDDDPLTFSWRQVDFEIPVVLNNANTATPTFTAPPVPNSLTLEFEVSVSDGINPPEIATTFVDVNAAAPGIVEGRVLNASNNPILGAQVRIVRSDGEVAPLGLTDAAGRFRVVGVRVGTNTVTVTSPGFEPVTATVTVPSGGTVVLTDFRLSILTAILTGEVLLADGTPLVNALVELRDTDGNVLSFARTDSAGEYRLLDLTRSTVNGASSISVSAPGIITWIVSNVNLTPSITNRRNFHYGNLQVTIETRPKNLRRFLDGVQVQVEIGDEVVAVNTADRKTRKFNFFNVPASTVKVRAFKPGDRAELTGAVAVVTVPSGRRAQRVTLTLRARGIF